MQLYTYADFGGAVCSVLSGATTRQLVVLTAPAFGLQSGAAQNLSLNSPHYGPLVFANAYTYNPYGYVTTVYPDSGKYYGGNIVTISGLNLGNGTDITLVTLKMVQASILNQTINDVTIVAGNVGSNHTGLGNATVFSRSYGQHGMIEQLVCIADLCSCGDGISL